jgi:protein pelota
VVKCVVVASPGFVKDQWMTYALAEAQRRGGDDGSGLRTILENRAKFVLAHASSGHTLSIQEVLQDPAVMARVADTKASGEVLALKELFEVMKANPDQAVYGIRHVQRAHELKAIKTLLLSDSLFRSSDVEQRKAYVALVESVRAAGCLVRIFSSLHASGQQLTQLTGAAAILRFPLPGLDDEIQEEVDAEHQESDEDESDGGDSDD